MGDDGFEALMRHAAEESRKQAMHLMPRCYPSLGDTLARISWTGGYPRPGGRGWRIPRYRADGSEIERGE